MLRPAELVSLLIDTAGAISKVDFNNASNRRAYQHIERQFSKNLTMQMKQFMVRNIEKTPFDNEQVNIQGDMFTLQELVGSLQNGGPVKQNSMGVLQMQMGDQIQANINPTIPNIGVPAGMKQEPIPGEVVVPEEEVQRDKNGLTKDTVKTQLREGDFVLNSLVKVTEGVGDLKKAFQTALDDAKQDGLDLEELASASGYARQGELVDVIVGDDEIIIPKELVKYFGLDKLEKMNNRGLKLAKAIEAATEQKQGQE
mgnify:CR=1 FL=1|tara:strand:+ start:63 stop:830 length:768 start_codon:yes stop_codon:yes gene_type:complete